MSANANGPFDLSGLIAGNLERLKGRSEHITSRGNATSSVMIKDSEIMNSIRGQFKRQDSDWNETAAAVVFASVIDYLYSDSAAFSAYAVSQAICAGFIHNQFPRGVDGLSDEQKAKLLNENEIDIPEWNCLLSAGANVPSKVIAEGFLDSVEGIWTIPQVGAQPVEGERDQNFHHILAHLRGGTEGSQKDTFRKALLEASHDWLDHSRLLCDIFICGVAKSAEHVQARLARFGDIGTAVGLNTPNLVIRLTSTTKIEQILSNLGGYRGPISLEMIRYDMLSETAGVDKGICTQYLTLVQLRCRFYGMGGFNAVIKACAKLNVPLSTLCEMLLHPSTERSFGLCMLMLQRLNDHDNLPDGVTPISSHYPFCYSRLIDDKLCDDLSAQNNPVLSYLCTAIDRLCTDSAAQQSELDKNRAFMKIPIEAKNKLWKWAKQVAQSRGDFGLLEREGNAYLDTALGKGSRRIYRDTDSQSLGSRHQNSTREHRRSNSPIEPIDEDGSSIHENDDFD